MTVADAARTMRDHYLDCARFCVVARMPTSAAHYRELARLMSDHLEMLADGTDRPSP